MTIFCGIVYDIYYLINSDRIQFMLYCVIASTPRVEKHKV